ncbi:MAG: Plug domain-containing protein, partial [Alphaproteobacteria bacterium]
MQYSSKGHGRRCLAGAGLLRGVAQAALLASASFGAPQAWAQASAAGEPSALLEEVIVTGSRIARTELTATSPVYTVAQEQIKLDRSLTVEDIFQKLPQAAGGANATGATVGDGLGSSTIDLRGLGQNRTLVLINGTRAVPFSFRNAVDVNAIPAGLIKRVDVLTGGAAAIYGADA